MCDPVTATAVVSGLGTLMTVSNQIDQGKYTQGVARYNAAVTRNQAQEARNAGNEAENLQRERTQALLSRQRVQLGASGIDLDMGSPLALQDDTLSLGGADALRIRSNTDRDVASLIAGSNLTLNQGDAARSLSQTQAAGTLLGGAGRVLDTGVADKWFTSKSAGRQG